MLFSRDVRVHVLHEIKAEKLPFRLKRVIPKSERMEVGSNCC